jgi:hypothetical protein
VQGPRQVFQALNPVAKKEAIMKFLSDTASNDLKKFLLAAFAVAATAVCLSPLAFAQSKTDPRPGTAAALQCLLLQGPKGCEHVFVGRATLAARPWVWPNPRRDFNRGPLEWSKYWGQASSTNVFDERVLRVQMTDEMDIFDVKFTHQEWTIYIAPADANGKIHYLAIRLYPPHDLNQLRM